MFIIPRGLVSEMGGGNMTSEVGHHGGGSQLYPNQDQSSEKIEVAKENAFSHLRALFQILSSMCFGKKLVFFYTTTFMLIHAHGEEQTGTCKLTNPAAIWDGSSVVDSETIGLCPCSSIELLPTQQMNVCILPVHLNVGNQSPDPLGPPIPSRANVKVMVTILAIIGVIALAGWMRYQRWRAFTEADIIMGLLSEPAVPRRNDPTFAIPSSIDSIPN